jgi:hypothetical protein
MKSSPSQLTQRGFIPDDYIFPETSLSPEAAIILLKSPTATERTFAARILAQSKGNFAAPLIKALRKEKKLYTKIEICNALIAKSPDSIKPLIAELGKIGNNQHKTIPAKKFNKDSYPLPRDIAARTLCRIGTPALPELQYALNSENLSQLSEAIDAIGHICFHSHLPSFFKPLKSCLIRNSDNDLIKWKIMRAMNAFPESLDFLTEQLADCSHSEVAREIERSQRIIRKK